MDKLFSSFYNKLNKYVNKHAPMKLISKRKVKQFSKPWITKGLWVSIRKKNTRYASVMKFSTGVIEIKSVA